MTAGAVNASPLRQPPRRFGALRLALFRTVERIAVALGGRALYRALNLSERRLCVRREVLHVPDLPEGLEGFRIAHLSDFHAGPFLRSGDLAAVIGAVRSADVQLAVLTGDFITRSADEARELVADLAGLASEHGTFAVFGNHDYRGRREAEIAEVLGAAGVRFLRDEAVRVDTGAGVLCVVGLEDLEEARSLDLEAARRDVRLGDVELVLCHNPAGAPALAREGCVAVLSGHTHGRQIDLPFLRRLGPTHPGVRVQHGPTALLVSRGLGVVGAPLRVRAPAELVLIELRRTRPGAQDPAEVPAEGRHG